MNLEEHLEYVREEDQVALYRMDVSALEGSLDDVIAILTAILAIDVGAALTDTGDQWDGHHWGVSWSRALRPDEIAKRERDRCEADAKRTEAEIARERQIYERLKRKYGDDK